MRSVICDLLKIDFPLVAFTHCRDVVVEVSKAGGMGVLGAAGLTPAELETELAWIDQHIDGKPYGVDLIIPDNFVGKDEKLKTTGQRVQVPEQHKQFVRGLLNRHDIETDDITDDKLQRPARLGENAKAEGARQLLDVAFAHPIALIANALGVPPQQMLARGKQQGVAVAALVGSKQHALKQVAAGVDILVVSGTEAGGHCGEVSTLVLIPEVARAVREHGDTPILAAGGIVTGEQMAACMAMGAAGAWTGSVWLTTSEAETAPVVKQKMLVAGSRDTIRSKSRTGKFSRQLRSAWTDAWEAEGAPKPLPMPLQSSVSEVPLHKVQKLAEGGHQGAKKLATYWVGQGVGLMNDEVSAKTVVYDFMQDFIQATERLTQFTQD